MSETVITHVDPSPALAENRSNGNEVVHDTFVNESSSEPEYAPIRRPRRFRRLAAFMVAIAVFGGALYATGVYVRNTNVWTSIWNAAHAQTAVANTDINLRAEPNATSDAIGLVTKNSKVRIVNSQNNWYQVDIIQQGRDRAGGPGATRGWLNGRYIDLDDSN